MTAVSPASILIPAFIDANGKPYNAARLFSYAAGTTTKLNTYLDSSGSTPQTNPIIVNASGYPSGSSGQPVDIWMETGVPYKLVFAPPGTDDPPTTTIWTVDNVVAGGGGSGPNNGLVIAGNGVPTIPANQGILYEQLDGPPGQSLYQSFGSGTADLESLMLADGAIHLYPLSETSGTVATDVGPSPSNGTYGGSYTLAQPALSADQPDAALFINGAVTLTYMDTTTGSFSIECLCAPADLTNGTLFANDSPESTGNGFKMVALSTGQFEWRVGCSAGVQAITSGVYVPFDSKIFQVVGVFDNVNHVTQLYVNGLLVGQSGSTGTYQSGADDIKIGKTPPGSGTVPFDGRMQLVGFYTIALSQIQVSNHYRAQFTTATNIWILIGGSSAQSSGGGAGDITYSYAYDDGSGVLPGQGTLAAAVGVNCSVPAGGGDSFAIATTGATSSTTFLIKRNHGGVISTLGNIVFAAGGSAGQQSGTINIVSPIVLAPGDVLYLPFPTADATLTGLVIGLVANR